MARATILMLVVFLSPSARAQTNRVVPAGTMLRCTLSEPNLSSATLQVGDPILCYVSSLRVFTDLAFPRGAYLSGRFEEYRDPGRFFGKGWLHLVFDRLVVPDAAIPVSTRIVAVTRYPVDREGRIQGRGHPVRDLLGWLFPPLWPIKVFTLPMRGPRPSLRGEVRVTLRLMDDVPLPANRGDREAPGLSKAEPPLTRTPLRGTSRTPHRLSRRLWYAGASWPALESALAAASHTAGEEAGGDGSADPESQDASPRAAQPRGEQLTVILLKDRPGYVVTDCWLEADQLECTIPSGESKVLPLEDVDLSGTVQINRERGVEFVLPTKQEER